MRREGPFDGVALLFALVFALFSVFMVIVCGARVRQEDRIASVAWTVPAGIERCWVTTSRTGGRLGTESHSLSCDVHLFSGIGAGMHTVTAGYPASRRGYDEWMESHPPRSTITLQLLPGPVPELTGLAALVPATTTALAAAKDSFRFALGAILLFALSRGIVLARARRRAVSTKALVRRRAA